MAKATSEIRQDQYLQVADTFIHHWQLAEDEYGNPIILSGGFGLADLQDLRAALEARLTAQVGAENVSQAASGERALAKKAVLERMHQFKHIVRAVVPDSSEAHVLPRLPKLAAGYDAWAKATQNIAQLWAMINAVTDIRLSGNYKIDQFVTDSENLLELFSERRAAWKALQRSQGNRNEIWLSLYERLIQYRRAIQGLFFPDTAILETLPRLVRRQGPTPKPVEVTGVWSPWLERAVISFTPSDNPHVSRYALRASTGAKVRVKDETLVATLAAGAVPTEFVTDFGLVEVGDRVNFRVVVILKDGARRSSKPVMVMRI